MRLAERTSGPHQGYQLFARSGNLAVDDGHVELPLGGQLARARSSSRRSRSASSSVPRPTSRRTSSSQDGGARNTNSASGIRSRTCRAPCRSISSRAGRPAASASSTGAARGAVACRAVDHGPLQQLVVGDQPVELLVADEVVVDAVDLARARRGRVVAETEIQTSGWCSRTYAATRALADRRRAGEHGQPRAVVRRHVTAAELGDQAATWLAPSPRTRRLSEMSSRSMICARAPCRRPASTAAGRRPASCRSPRCAGPRSRTSAIEAPECLSRFLTSARSRREAAALSRAAWRCSGVSGGRATGGPRLRCCVSVRLGPWRDLATGWALQQPDRTGNLVSGARAPATRERLSAETSTSAVHTDVTAPSAHGCQRPRLTLHTSRRLLLDAGDGLDHVLRCELARRRRRSIVLLGRRRCPAGGLPSPKSPRLHPGVRRSVLARPSSASRNVCHSSREVVRRLVAEVAEHRQVRRAAPSPPGRRCISAISWSGRWRSASQYVSSLVAARRDSVSSEREGQDRRRRRRRHATLVQQRRERLRGLLGRGAQPGRGRVRRRGSPASCAGSTRRARRRRSGDVAGVPPWAPIAGHQERPVDVEVLAGLADRGARRRRRRSPSAPRPALASASAVEHGRPRHCARRRSGACCTSAPPGWRSARARTPRRRARAPSSSSGSRLPKPRYGEAVIASQNSGDVGSR